MTTGQDVKESQVRRPGRRRPRSDRHDELASCPTTRSSARVEFDPALLLQRFREASYLTKGIWLSFIDERTDKEITFYFEGGIQSFVRHLNKDREVLFSRPIYVEKRESAAPPSKCAIQYNASFNEAAFSFANASTRSTAAAT